MVPVLCRSLGRGGYGRYAAGGGCVVGLVGDWAMSVSDGIVSGVGQRRNLVYR